MKITTILAVLAAATVSANAASITLNSVGPGAPNTSGWFDNAGNPTLSTYYFFTGVSPTDFASAAALIGTEVATGALTGPGGGLISGGFNVPNSGALTNQPLFVIFANSDNSSLAAYQLNILITKADSPPPPFSGTEQLDAIGNVTLGTATAGTVDHSALGPVPDGTGFNVLAAAIPEPSSALLLGLGGLGLLIRRKR